MDNFSEVPIPPEEPKHEEYAELSPKEEPMEMNVDQEEESHNDENTEDVDGDSLWQQHLVETEQEILKEKENGKRPIEETNSDDEPSAKKRATEFDKLWNNVNENPTDFQAWTMLLQYVDQVSDLDAGKEAYDSFFSRYPNCYGYWKKYADLEKRKGTDESVLKVFNRGLDSIGLSVDLWIHFLEYVTTKFTDDEDFVREQFERSINSCGIEFRSDKLWDLYISWETNGKRWHRVTQVYDRLLATPVSKYMQHWQKFQEHVKKHSLNEVLDAEEYKIVRRAALAQLNRLDSEDPDEAPPGVEDLPDDEQESADKLEEETKVMRDLVLDSRRKSHEETSTMSKSRWALEDAIKRPYFHVKPLEKSQLTAWRNYLDFELKEGIQGRIKVLFERCLIACAFYEEFWMRYVRYLEESDSDEEDLRSVYRRACKIHLREKLRPHLSWAAFEEEKGCSDDALNILSDIQDTLGMCLEAHMMAAAVQRRRNNLEEAEAIYVRCLESLKEKENKNAYASIAVKYGRFLTLFRGDSDKAMEVIQEAYDYDESNSALLLALADCALSCRPPKISAAANALRCGAEATGVPPTARLMFSHRYFQFVTECAVDLSSTNEALRLLRKTQQESRQAQASVESSISSEPKSNETSLKGVKAPPPPEAKVNGSPGVVPSVPPPSGPYPYSGQQSQSSYGGFNQYPQGGYGQGQYPNWGYPAQQGGGGYSGYNQQGWGSYPNYYGQR